MPEAQSGGTLKPSVFHYFDFTAYLKQSFDFEKAENKKFSHRFIALRLGVKSSSFFKDVLAKRIKITPARAAAFAKLMHLNQVESEYFEQLVQYNQAETQQEKEMFLERLLRKSKSKLASPLQAFQKEYFNKWYYAAIRELLALREFRGDYAALAAELSPAISPSEAMEAVNLLVRLGMIHKTAQGHYQKVDKVVSSGSELKPEMIRPAIEGNIQLALEALNAYPQEVRPFSYLTLSVSEESFNEIAERIRSFRRDVLEIVTKDAKVDRLYQLNIQFFPVSNPPKP
jgi:uncharacterized protein (TIGR02147 family)